MQLINGTKMYYLKYKYKIFLFIMIAKEITELLFIKALILLKQYKKGSEWTQKAMLKKST